MLPMILGFLSLIPYVLIALFVAFTDYLDWHGRMEVLETKHPRIAKVVENRALRLVLLLMVFGMLAVDLRENLKQIEIEPFLIKIVAAPTADPGAIHPEVAKWKAKYEALTGIPEPKNSLRRRTVRLANEIARFWNERPTPAQPVQTPTTDEERKRNSEWQKYWQDAAADYNARNFRDRLLNIIREYDVKGVPTWPLEAQVKNNGLFGAMMFGGAGQEDQVLCGTPVCQLRELAFHVDGQDAMITTNF